MRFKVGDKVEIIRQRDINVPAWDGSLVAGKAGVIERIYENARAESLHGVIAVVTATGSTHYCKEAEIKHLDGPETPYDKELNLPRNKWMRMLRWYGAPR